MRVMTKEELNGNSVVEAEKIEVLEELADVTEAGPVPVPEVPEHIKPLIDLYNSIEANVKIALKFIEGEEIVEVINNFELAAGLLKDDQIALMEQKYAEANHKIMQLVQENIVSVGYFAAVKLWETDALDNVEEELYISTMAQIMQLVTVAEIEIGNYIASRLGKIVQNFMAQ